MMIYILYRVFCCAIVILLSILFVLLYDCCGIFAAPWYRIKFMLLYRCVFCF